MLTMGLSHMALIMLRYSPSIPNLLSVFIMKDVEVSQVHFPASFEMTIWALSFIFLMFMISQFHLCVSVFCCISYLIMLLQDDYFEIFVKQFIDLRIFKMNYWSFITLSYWCHTCLILCDLCILLLVSVHLKEQISSGLYRLFLTNKDFL